MTLVVLLDPSPLRVVVVDEDRLSALLYPVWYLVPSARVPQLLPELLDQLFDQLEEVDWAWVAPASMHVATRARAMCLMVWVIGGVPFRWAGKAGLEAGWVGSSPVKLAG